MSTGVLIIGLGAIGMEYDLHLDNEQILSHAKAFSLHPDFNILGGVDNSADRRILFEKHYCARAYPDLETALKNIQPALIVIATPTKTHADLLSRALALCSPKVILCEKPLSYDITEAREMVQLCKEKKIKLYVNYMRRSDPGVIEIKRRFDLGEISQPVKGIVWYSKGLLHNGSHFFNLLSYWLDGLKVARVLETGRMWQNVDPEPDLDIQFTRGKVFFLSKPEEDYSHYTIELIAPNGRLRYETAGRDIIWQPAIQNPIFNNSRSISIDIENIPTKLNQFQYNVATQLALVIDGKSANLCTGDDALQTLQSLITITGIK